MARKKAKLSTSSKVVAGLIGVKEDSKMSPGGVIKRSSRRTRHSKEV